jgi:DNA-binding PucR family transcriptional regulator
MWISPHAIGLIGGQPYPLMPLPTMPSPASFDQQPVAVLLASAPDASESVARRILGPVLDLPDDDRAVVIDTVRAWLADAGSTSTAAARLHVRLEELTGRSLANPLDLAELHVALECARMLGLA